MAEKHTVVAVVKSSTGRGTYNIAITPQPGIGRELWMCGCPAWTRHTPRKDCKHITKVKKVMDGTNIYDKDVALTTDGQRAMAIMQTHRNLAAQNKLPSQQPPPPPDPNAKPTGARGTRPARRFGR